MTPPIHPYLCVYEFACAYESETSRRVILYNVWTDSSSICLCMCMCTTGFDTHRPGELFCTHVQTAPLPPPTPSVNYDELSRRPTLPHKKTKLSLDKSQLPQHGTCLQDHKTGRRWERLAFPKFLELGKGKGGWIGRVLGLRRAVVYYLHTIIVTFWTWLNAERMRLKGGLWFKYFVWYFFFNNAWFLLCKGKNLKVLEFHLLKNIIKK